MTIRKNDQKSVKTQLCCHRIWPLQFKFEPVFKFVYFQLLYPEEKNTEHQNKVNSWVSLGTVLFWTGFTTFLVRGRQYRVDSRLPSFLQTQQGPVERLWIICANEGFRFPSSFRSDWCCACLDHLRVPAAHKNAYRGMPAPDSMCWCVYGSLKGLKRTLWTSSPLVNVEVCSKWRNLA